jgi:hypothetical protein
MTTDATSAPTVQNLGPKLTYMGETCEEDDESLPDVTRQPWRCKKTRPGKQIGQREPNVCEPPGEKDPCLSPKMQMTPTQGGSSVGTGDWVMLHGIKALPLEPLIPFVASDAVIIYSYNRKTTRPGCRPSRERDESIEKW